METKAPGGYRMHVSSHLQPVSIMRGPEESASMCLGSDLLSWYFSVRLAKVMTRWELQSHESDLRAFPGSTFGAVSTPMAAWRGGTELCACSRQHGSG